MNLEPTEKRILYVDDEPKSLKYFTKMFEDRFSILTANSADQAMQCIEAAPETFGVLVTDQRMPEKTGVQLMEQVRFRYPNIVRILLTAFTELDAAVKAVNEGGAFRYLTKPFDKDDMVGTLLRAQEYHKALDERDRLLGEKLSVFHHLIIMDRVRGLATATAALNGQLRNAWPALVAYMKQSPIQSRIRVQMEEIAGLNVVGVARREAEVMVKTVVMLQEDTIGHASDQPTTVKLNDFVQEFVDASGPQLQDDDIEVTVEGSDDTVNLETDAGMLRRLLEIVIRRMSDIQDQPALISFQINREGSEVVVRVKGSFDALTSGEHASFFSAAIPLHKWPIGLDMDLLSAFMIVHHLGGELTVFPAPPQGPGLTFSLPLVAKPETSTNLDSKWFDTVFETLVEWERQSRSQR